MSPFLWEVPPPHQGTPFASEVSIMSEPLYTSGGRPIQESPSSHQNHPYTSKAPCTQVSPITVCPPQYTGSPSKWPPVTQPPPSHQSHTITQSPLHIRSLSFGSNSAADGRKWSKTGGDRLLMLGMALYATCPGSVLCVAMVQVSHHHSKEWLCVLALECHWLLWCWQMATHDTDPGLMHFWMKIQSILWLGKFKRYDVTGLPLHPIQSENVLH